MRGVVVHRQKFDKGGRALIDAMANYIAELVDRRAPEFVDDALTRRALDYVEQELPELVSAVVPGIISATQLSEILKALVKEGISVRNLDLILQAVAECADKQANERSRLEEIRIALRRVISSKYAKDGIISGFTLSPQIDLAFMQSEREGKEVTLAFLDTISSQVAHAPIGSVLLVSRATRRLLRECLAVRKISIPVMAFEELADDISFSCHATISMPTNKCAEENEKIAA